MGSVYRRGRKLWIKYKDATGNWVSVASGFEVGQEKAVRTLIDRIEARIVAGVDFGPGPVTVTAYFERWIKDRRKRGVASFKDDDGRIRLHALPTLGQLRLDEVRPRHVRDLMRGLKAGGLAPRTVRNIYGALHRMFEDALVDELIDSTPCKLKRKELPRPVDKDPTWRQTAVFSRDEVFTILAAEQVPPVRRVQCGLMFLGGLHNHWGALAS